MSGAPITFAQRLRSERDRQEMSVEALADKAQVKSRTVERWEAGETEPRIDYAARVASVLGVSLDWLAGIEEPVA